MKKEKKSSEKSYDAYAAEDSSQSYLHKNMIINSDK